MRKSILGAFIGLVLASLYVWADSTTTNFGFTIPSLGSAGWGPKISTNFITLDGAVPGLDLSNTFGSKGSSTNTFMGPTVLSTASVYQIFVGTSILSSKSEAITVKGNAKFFGTTGAVLSLCDVGGLNCTNMSLETANPSKGVVVSTMSLNSIRWADGTVQTSSPTSTTFTGSGVVSPGTFTWVNNNGIQVSTFVVTQTLTGATDAVTITSTGTGKALYIIPQGKAGNAYQDSVGAVTIEKLSGVPTEFLVLHDSTTDAQLGMGLLEIWEDATAHNDPLIWIHNTGSSSNPFMRVDDYAPDMEIVNLSTNNAVGYGKWEPFAMANGGVDLQINNRAYDNSTFETLAYWHPLSKIDLMPGLYMRPQNVVEDAGIVTSSDTSGLTFFTLDSHTVGLTAPKNTTASYTFALPSTVGATGEVMYHGGNRGGTFNARKMEWSGTDFLYSPTTGVSITTMTVTSGTVSGNLYTNNLGVDNGVYLYNVGRTTYTKLFSTFGGWNLEGIGFDGSFNHQASLGSISNPWATLTLSDSSDVPVFMDSSRFITRSSNSLFIGNGAGTTDGGLLNTSFGDSTLSSVVGAGQQNVAVGYASLGALTTGYQNVSIGAYSMLISTMGFENVSVGFSALQGMTTGYENVAIGRSAGYSNSSGSTTNSLTSGSKNVFIGPFAGMGTSTQLTNAIAIGYSAEVNNSNTMQLGGAGANSVLVTLSSVAASGYIQNASKTLAQIQAITPTAVGQSYYCSNCTTDAVCVSTGTGPGAFSRVSARTTACN